MPEIVVEAKMYNLLGKLANSKKWFLLGSYPVPRRHPMLDIVIEAEDIFCPIISTHGEK